MGCEDELVVEKVVAEAENVDAGPESARV